MSPLPQFRYHPDPLATGSIRPSNEPCGACSNCSGYVYVGPIYGPTELKGPVCPWCIANGIARARFGIEFTDLASIGGSGWPMPATAVVEEVAWRTPGFSGWQQERWFTCCNDAAAFLGHAGATELAGRWAGARQAIALECGFTGDELKDYMDELQGAGSPTAYVFRCLHCGAFGGYSDAN